MNWLLFDKVVTGAVLLGVGLLVVYLKGDIPSGLLSLMQWIYMGFVAGAGFDKYVTNKNG